jgi:hypothetical protein
MKWGSDHLHSKRSGCPNADVILGEAEFSGRIKGLLKGEEIGQDIVWEK